ncbi:hypothetical protein quinque_015216 [Culex quinquefasciatus]
MASASAANSTLTGIPSSSLASSRSRSNSQSGGSSGGGGGSGSGSGGHRKEPKSGDAQSSGSVVIQDSGFSTETSSSKETHSASSSTGNGGGVLLLQGGNVSNTTAASHQQRLDTEDELWNLLDVIHRKSNRLREEVDALQQLEREKCRTNVLNQNQNVVGQNSGTDCLSSFPDYEAEAMASRIRATKMQDDVDVLAAAKRDLEGQLQAALSQKLELNTKIHDLHQQFVNKSAPSRHLQTLTPSSGVGLLRKHSSTDSTTTTLHLSTSTTSSPSSNSQQHLLKPSATRAGSSFAPIVKSSAKAEAADHHPTSPDAALGKLDGLLSSPARVNKVRMTDSKKIAAILLETNIVELQRHHADHHRAESEWGSSEGGGGSSSGSGGHRKEPKSGDAQSSGSVVIQDSGFSTETSSSKETHSASSSTGNGGGVLLLQGGNVSNTTAASHQQRLDTEDELWNLLDVIHRKSNRLREEVDALQQLEREKCRTNVLNQNQNVVGQNSGTDCLSSFPDYEAEAMASRIRATKMQDDVDVLAAAKRDLEGQLQAALSQKLELNTKIHDLHQQFVNKSAPSRHLQTLTPSSGVGLLRKHSSTDSTTTTLHLSTSTTSSPSSNSQQHLLKPSATRAGSSFAPIVKSSAKAEAADHHPTSPDAALGKLDGLLSSPARVNKVRMTDSKKIAAILLETNIVELQRHLLTITVQNQVLQQRLEYATRSRIFMSKKLDKSKEDIDDLKFRLEEKNIELEGTKAQLRVLESKQQQHQSGKSSVASSGFSPEHHPTAPAIAAAATPTALVAPVKPSVVSTSAGGIVTSQPFHHQQRDLTLRLQQASQVSTPSMKAMIPLAMDEVLHHSSSTESAQDQAERLTYPETPKRKPSKIPLPGTKGYVAPKPPTGRNFVANAPKNSPSPSGSLSNKSLNKSTGSLYMRSTGPSSISSGNRVVRDTSMNRPESAQSWSRRDTSLEKSRSSSIPVSSKGSPVAAKPPPSAVVSSSPQPKAKRDSLTTRVKNLDSLSRLQTAASTGNLSKSSSKKDLSSTSFSTGRPKQASGGGGIRRVSSASIGRSSSTEHSGGSSSNGSSSVAASPTDNSDNGKARRTNTSGAAPRWWPATATAQPSAGRRSAEETNRRVHANHNGVLAGRHRPRRVFVFLRFRVRLVAVLGDHGHHDRVALVFDAGSARFAGLDRGVSGGQESNSGAARHFDAAAGGGAAPRRDTDDLELAYKHPILLMNDEDEQNVFCSVVSSVGNERNREVEVRARKESLIVPKPKKMAFHSLKGSPVKNGADDQDAKCRLVGKVNPNILKTWEQLSGGDKGEPVAKRKSSLITVTSSENSADSKQSCLIFYRNQYNNLTAPEEEEFHVNRIQHGSVSTTSSSSTMEEPKAAADPRTTSMVTSTTTTETTSSEGCYDFYDSIDDSSTRIDGVVLEEDEDDDEYAMAAGEGLADFTSLDRKKMMWSIDVE